MKKLICAVFAMVFASALFAAPGAAPTTDKDVSEMMTLVQKYQKEKNPEAKAKIEAQVKEKVSARYDEHLANMEERLNQAETRLAESKDKLVQAKTAEGRKANIDDITQDILKGEKPFMAAPKGGKWGGRGLRSDGTYGLMGGPKGEHMPPPCACSEDKGCSMKDKMAGAEGKDCKDAKKGCPCQGKMKAMKDKAHKKCKKGDCPFAKAKEEAKKAADVKPAAPAPVPAPKPTVQNEP